MIFSVSRDGIPPCPKCGQVDRPSVWTHVKRNGMYVYVQLCEECIWRAVMGDKHFEAEADRMVAQAEVRRQSRALEDAMKAISPKPWWKFW